MQLFLGGHNFLGNEACELDPGPYSGQKADRLDKRCAAAMNFVTQSRQLC
jgi:hypothetical protein